MKDLPAIPADQAAFYEATAGKHLTDLESPAFGSLRVLASLPMAERSQFLDAPERWCSAYNCLAHWDAYLYLLPLSGIRLLQVGGSGHTACLFALVGSIAHLVTPVKAEADLASEFARLAGVRLTTTMGVAEELPFPSNSFDRIIANGCVHHFDTAKAFPEIHRVLKAGGRFAGAEPWRAPFYSLGTRIFGKREPVAVMPLTQDRLYPAASIFKSFHVIHHGTLTRYAALALRRLIPLSVKASWRLTTIDDRLSSLLRIRRFGSSISLLAEK